MVDFDHPQSQRNQGTEPRIPLCRKCHLQRGQYGDEKFQRVQTRSIGCPTPRPITDESGAAPKTDIERMRTEI